MTVLFFLSLRTKGEKWVTVFALLQNKQLTFFKDHKEQNQVRHPVCVCVHAHARTNMCFFVCMSLS